MADISVLDLADKLKLDIKELLTRLDNAGLKKTKNDLLTEEESKSFVAYLVNKDNKTDLKPKKLTLRRKRTDEELVTDAAGGRKHKVKVIRRKERIVQTGSILNDIRQEAVAEPAPAPIVEEIKQESNLEINSPVSETVLQGHKPTTVASGSNDDVKAESAKTETKTIKDKDKKKKIEVKDPVAEKKIADDKEAVKALAKTKKQLQLEEEKSWNSRAALKDLDVEEDSEENAILRHNLKKHKIEKFVKKPEAIKNIKPQHAFIKPKESIIHEVTVPEEITVGELAQRMAIKSGKLIKTLMQMGHMATINQVLDQDTATLVVEELGHKAKQVKSNAIEEVLRAKNAQLASEVESITRAPVVTIMGHVDHGKTSLLDYIRTSKVAAKEAGGITQHIGAYTVDASHGKITFIDTPGHAAFSAMRARGANVTDVVVLVVAADDGVMPQTIEAIQHAKAAGVPIVVAVNKMDKPEADPDRVKTELSHHEIISEEWGGEHQFVPVSAKTGLGIEALLDAILVQTEILELKAPIDVPAQGVVIESRLDKGRGVVATVLIQKGTLNKGDILIAGAEYGRVRAMLSAAGQRIDKAGPSEPVEVLGLSSPPNAGDEVSAVATEREARELALYRQNHIRSQRQSKLGSSSVEDLFSKAKDSNMGVLNIIVKADLQGSVEAISASLDKMATSEVKVKIIGRGVGGINESDVTLAMASKAIIIGFNVRAEAGARKLSETESVKIIYDSIIYNVIDDVKQILSGMLSPEIREEILGLAQVRDVFRSSKIGAIAGCMVIEGIVKRNNPIRVLRDNVVIFEGELESLRRFKDDASEVKQGMECGIGVKNYNDVKVGDQIEVFKKVSVERKLA